MLVLEIGVAIAAGLWYVDFMRGCNEAASIGLTSAFRITISNAVYL